MKEEVNMPDKRDELTVWSITKSMHHLLSSDTYKKIEKRIEELKLNPPEYYIGIDAYSDDTESSFCLVRKTNDSYEVILAKNERNKDNFIEQVNNLAKYFNAIKIETNGKTERIRRKEEQI